MNALPLTFSLLALIAIATLGSIRCGTDRHLLFHTLQGHLEAERAIENSYQRDLYQIKCHMNLPRQPSEGSKPKPSTTKTRPKRRRLPQYPSHLNLKHLGNDPLYAEILTGLLDHLSPSSNNEQLVATLCQRLLEERPADQFQGQLTLAEELAALDLGPHQQRWAKLLRSGLLDTVTISDDPKINVAWAPRPLLIALFQDPNIADSVIACRERLVAEYLADQTEEPSDALLKRKSKEFEESVSLLLSHTTRFHHCRPALDFRLRHTPKKITFASPTHIPLKKRRIF